MALKKPITMTANIRQRNQIKLPEAFTMTNGLNKKDVVNVTIGQNFSCVIITPVQAELSSRMKERIEILTMESLDSTR